MKFQISFPKRYFKVCNAEENVGNDGHKSWPWGASVACGGEIWSGREVAKSRFLKKMRERERKGLNLFPTRCFERWGCASDNIVLQSLQLPTTDTDEAVNTTQMTFSATFLEKKTKGSFFKPFKKQGGKGIETVPASSWFDGHLIFQSTIPRGRTWRNSVKPVFDETSTIQPVGLFEKKNKTRAASLMVRPPPVFKILKYLPFLFSSSPSSIRIPQDGGKTPLEIVNKPATHTRIKQKDTWTIPPSLHGFITRCKLKTKEERNDTTEFIWLKAFISGFFIPQP